MEICDYDCIYCGMTAQARDHVIPYSYESIRTKRDRDDYPLNKIVPACKECNDSLHDFMYPSIAERAAYIARKLRKKYKKLLNSPDWSQDELEELSGNLEGHVKKLQHKKKLVIARIGLAEERSKLENLTPEAFWKLEGVL